MAEIDTLFAIVERVANQKEGINFKLSSNASVSADPTKDGEGYIGEKNGENVASRKRVLRKKNFFHMTRRTCTTSW